eukprot:1907510-Rhodomonas_salina.1
MGSNHSGACTCDRGYYDSGQHNCTLCPANSWCWGGVKNNCPADRVSEPGLSWPDNCTCAGGFYKMLPKPRLFCHTPSGKGSTTTIFMQGGYIWGWGYNGDGGSQLTGPGRPTIVSDPSSYAPIIAGSLSPVIDVAIGSSHACVLLSLDVPGINTVRCWGVGSNGQTGRGNTAIAVQFGPTGDHPK